MSDQPAADATVSWVTANLVAVAFIPLTILGLCLPYALIWGDAMVSLERLFEGMVWWTAVFIFLLSIIVHELLHAVGYMWAGGVPRTAIKFGFSWRGLAPYAHCHQPMTARAYRTAVLLPGLILGLIPGILGLLFGSFWLTLFGTIMLIAAGGDAAVLLAIRQLPASTIVRDHPSKVGCEILSHS
jgi:hypothetical protein